MASNYSPVFVANGDGTNSPAPFLMDRATGQMIPANLPASMVGARFTDDQCTCKGGTITSAAAIASVGRYPTGSTGILPAASPYGDVQTVRATSANTSGGGSNLLTLTIANTAATSYTGIIGDGAEFLQIAGGYAALPGTITFGGTYGALTKQQFDNLSALLPSLLAGFKMTSTTANFFANAVFRTLTLPSPSAIINLTPVVENWNLAILPASDQFNATIQANTDWRCLLCPISGIEYTMPANSSVTVTFELRNVEDSWLMGRN